MKNVTSKTAQKECCNKKNDFEKMLTVGTQPNHINIYSKHTKGSASNKILSFVIS